MNTTTVREITRLNEADGTFAERFPVLFETSGRRHKAAKVIAVLSDYFGAKTSRITVLDIGCSTGIMTREFARAFGRVIGLDVDKVGIVHGDKLARQENIDRARLTFCGGDGCRIPLAEGSIDAVVCNQVYEHVDDQTGLMDEIHRVLRPGGACYFGIGTRHVLVEGHYKLPFLSWIPHRAADLYMKLAGKRGRYDVRLLSYRRLKRLVRRLAVIDYTLAVIKRPSQFADDERGPLRRWVARWPVGLLQTILPVIPVHVWLLVKPSDDGPWSAGSFVPAIFR